MNAILRKVVQSFILFPRLLWRPLPLPDFLVLLTDWNLIAFPSLSSRILSRAVFCHERFHSNPLLRLQLFLPSLPGSPPLSDRQKFTSNLEYYCLQVNGNKLLRDCWNSLGRIVQFFKQPQDSSGSASVGQSVWYSSGEWVRERERKSGWLF